VALIPGRSCPRSYRYGPNAFARAPDLTADTVYAIGGLYGNEQALDVVLALRADDADATLIFNGDFNWFNVDAASFVTINRQVLTHTATRGNVETEMASDNDEAGCGCAYPQWVGDADVERSNDILNRLRETARAAPELRSRLGALASHLVAEVGGVRIAIVHGDLESLAGWDLAQEHLGNAETHASIAQKMLRSSVRIVASSHTCLPVALQLGAADDALAVVNNGAAGMPNFRGTRFGVITRISVRPVPHVSPLYSLRIGPVYVEALPVHYAHYQFVRAFLANWPAGSAAHRSYFGRIENGPQYSVTQAMRRAAITLRASA